MLFTTSHRGDIYDAIVVGASCAGLSFAGAATGGGIYPALISGRQAAQAVANEILNGVPSAVKMYLHDLPHAGRLGHLCKVEDWLRWAIDRFHTNTDLWCMINWHAPPSDTAGQCRAHWTSDASWMACA
jgi:hypothetical protein